MVKEANKKMWRLVLITYIIYIINITGRPTDDDDGFPMFPKRNENFASALTLVLYYGRFQNECKKKSKPTVE
jgi:hypothetical protein